MVRQRNSTIKVNWTKNNKPLEGADITSHAQVGELVVMGYSGNCVIFLVRYRLLEYYLINNY